MTLLQAAVPYPSPIFSQRVMLGQHNVPSWDRYEAAMRDIFERRYYTNQGPLARRFEERLQDFLVVRHAVCVTNVTIGLMMAIEALGVHGRVLVPGVCNTAALHALAWCGAEPAFCDVDPVSGHLSVAGAQAAHDDQVKALLGANLWGDASAAPMLTAFAAARGMPVLFDSAHSLGCEIAGRRVGTFGQIEVLGFGEGDILNAAGAACVTTDDDELAARLRNIRSSYGAGRPVPVVKTSNGRMSEAQAALGLLSVDGFALNRKRNQTLFDAYLSQLRGIAGIRVVEPHGAAVSNHQSLVCAVDERVFGLSRDRLIDRLSADNIEARAVDVAQDIDGLARPLPTTGHIAASWLMLPIGAHVDVAMVATVCEIIGRASLQADGASV